MRFAKTPTMRPAYLLAVGASALLVAACGGSSAGSGHLASSTTSPSAPATTGSATATTPASTAPPGTASTAQGPPGTSTSGGAAVSGAPPCRAGELSATFLGGQGATGHGELGFALRNIGQHTCTTVGYPGVQFLDRAGQALPTEPTHTTQDFFGSVPEAALTVAPGATVSFRLGVTHGAASPNGCTTAYGLQVIPPNDTASLRVAIPGGAFECQTTTVSPLAQGTSAYS
jgi:hypothetical protein